jgi:hypothetical protein
MGGRKNKKKIKCCFFNLGLMYKGNYWWMEDKKKKKKEKRK